MTSAEAEAALEKVRREPETEAEQHFDAARRAFAGLPYLDGLALLVNGSRPGRAVSRHPALELIGGVVAVHGRAAVIQARQSPGFPYGSLSDAELIEVAHAVFRAGSRITSPRQQSARTKRQ